MSYATNQLYMTYVNGGLYRLLRCTSLVVGPQKLQSYWPENSGVEVWANLRDVVPYLVGEVLSLVEATLLLRFLH